MRASVLAPGLALALTMAAAPTVALAASTPSQTVTINFYSVQFTSLLGGTISGSVVVSGDIADGEIGRLRGTANFPLRDENVTIEPTAPLALSTQQLSVNWWKYTCDQFGCVYTQGFSTFERQYAQGPVDIRLGQLRGSGTLNIGTEPTCVAECPPAGANYWVSYGGYSSVYNAAVLGSQDAGTLGMNGPAPVIH